MTPVNERLCHACQKVEDEFYFMMECKSNSDLRQTLINKLTTRCPNFADLSQREQFVNVFTNEDNMSLTWLGKFIYKSFQRRNNVGSNLWNICWSDYSLCIYIYIYLKTLYIDIKSSSDIHESYTSQCIHILLTIIYFMLPGPVYVFWLFYDVSHDYEYQYRTCDMAFIWKSVVLYKWFYTSNMHIMRVYVCTTQFDFTWTLYTRDFTWTLYITDNEVYIHLRMYTCLMLFLNVCFIVW